MPPRVRHSILAGFIRQKYAMPFLARKQRIKTNVYYKIDRDMSDSDTDYETEDEQLYDHMCVDRNPRAVYLKQKYKTYGTTKANLVL